MALANNGSVRAAGGALGISHSTVARRIEAFEDQLGVRLFDRTPSGYAPTAAGDEMLGVAARMDEEVSALERRILGQDTRLAGEIRVTLPSPQPLHRYEATARLDILDRGASSRNHRRNAHPTRSNTWPSFDRSIEKHASFLVSGARVLLLPYVSSQWSCRRHSSSSS